MTTRKDGRVPLDDVTMTENQTWAEERTDLEPTEGSDEIEMSQGAGKMTVEV